MWKSGEKSFGGLSPGPILSMILYLFLTGNLLRCLPVSASDSNLERRGKNFWR